MYIDVYYAMLYAHFSLAQAMRDPVTYGFILDVDILNIFHSTTSSGQLLTT